jgi:hypothetical protein
MAIRIHEPSLNIALVHWPRIGIGTLNSLEMIPLKFLTLSLERDAMPDKKENVLELEERG